LGRVNNLTTCLAQTAAAATEPLKVGNEPQPVPPPAKKVRVRVWAEGLCKTFTEGDRPRFKVIADQDAYLYLFDIAPDGRTVMLFPNAEHRDNFAHAGKVLTIPSGEMKFCRFTVSCG